MFAGENDNNSTRLSWFVDSNLNPSVLLASSAAVINSGEANGTAAIQIQRGVAVRASWLRQYWRDPKTQTRRSFAWGFCFSIHSTFQPPFLFIFCFLLQWIEKQGKTPLILACIKQDGFQIAKLLVELGANIDFHRPGPSHIRHPYLFFAIFTYKSLLVFIVIAGSHAGTALHHAAKRGNEQIVTMLLSYGGVWIGTTYIQFLYMSSILLNWMNSTDVQQILWSWMMLAKLQSKLQEKRVIAMLFESLRYKSISFLKQWNLTTPNVKQKSFVVTNLQDSGF